MLTCTVPDPLAAGIVITKGGNGGIKLIAGRRLFQGDTKVVRKETGRKVSSKSAVAFNQLSERVIRRRGELQLRVLGGNAQRVTIVGRIVYPVAIDGESPRGKPRGLRSCASLFLFGKAPFGPRVRPFHDVTQCRA